MLLGRRWATPECVGGGGGGGCCYYFSLVSWEGKDGKCVMVVMVIISEN